MSTHVRSSIYNANLEKDTAQSHANEKTQLLD